METALWLFGILATLTLAARLYLSGLYVRFRTLFFYCWILLPRAVAGRVFPADSARYAWAWIVTEALTWLALLLMVTEVHSSIFERFPSLMGLGRRLLHWGLAISVVASMTLAFAVAPANGDFPILQAMLLTQRVVLGSLVGFLFLLILVLGVIRVPLRRNALVFAVIFFCYLLAKGLLVLTLQTVGPPVWRPVSLAIELVSNLAILGLAIGLSPAGEVLNISKETTWDETRSSRLVRQLNELNDALTPKRPKAPPAMGEPGDAP